MSLNLPDALTVAGIDAGNLLPVAEVMRRKYPLAQIVIAADNDRLDDKPNTGTERAEKAALSVDGYVSVPPTDYKADWNDYHQQHGWQPLQQPLTIRCINRRGQRETAVTGH